MSIYYLARQYAIRNTKEHDVTEILRGLLNKKKKVIGESRVC
jgi:hypothetical protein